MRQKDGVARPMGRGIVSSRMRGVLIFVLLAVLLVGSTFALLTALTNRKANVFTFVEEDITIIEEFDDWEVKEVKLKVSNDSAPSVVRAMIVPVLYSEYYGEHDPRNVGYGGNMGPLGAPSGNTLVVGDLTFVFAVGWETKWFYLNGYFYYNEVLYPGETTPQALLAQVIPTSGVNPALYEGTTITVEVLADAIQAEGNAPAQWGVKVIDMTRVEPL